MGRASGPYGSGEACDPASAAINADASWPYCPTCGHLLSDMLTGRGQAARVVRKAEGHSSDCLRALDAKPTQDPTIKRR